MCHCPHQSSSHRHRAGQRISQEELENIQFLDDGNWMEFAKSEHPGIIFFMIGTSRECSRCIPDIVDFVGKHGSRYNVGVIDVAKAPNAAECCNVDHLPSFAIVCNGIMLDIQRGCVDEENEKVVVEMLVTAQGRSTAGARA